MHEHRAIETHDAVVVGHVTTEIEPRSARQAGPKFFEMNGAILAVGVDLQPAGRFAADLDLLDIDFRARCPVAGQRMQ